MLNVTKEIEVENQYCQEESGKLLCVDNHEYRQSVKMKESDSKLSFKDDKENKTDRD